MVVTAPVGRGRYRHGLFFAHLAIEKAVNARVSLRTQDHPPKIHNHPDSLPAPVGQDEAQRLLAQAHEVLQWLIAP